MESEIHKEIRRSVRDFVDREVLPVADELDNAEAEIPMPIIQKMAELGYFGLIFPESYGGMALDTLAGILEQRGDLEAAADTLRQSDGAQRTVYPQSGPGGFFWLQARAHLLKIEQRLGHLERSDAIARELHRFLAVADPDFVVRQAVG